ncbi:MAG TPA: hypothetical protein PKW08_06760 [Flavobacteriaceae bacterium]|nr:hypothetical protein [Flavobacteriaceae bacterium]MCB9212830.1 hypothetical protein [Alteromonas sp.]HPF12281.1 hypothetical protein [Flavobacteriaceae bacterium]HQU21271.1 hypothetical protein [Flavobacteriaceae bacterium]HQU66056.1 hypothetical protein [Flavobacteriaceae bacterium]
MKIKLFFFAFSLGLLIVRASEIHVPADYPTIQEAIDAASTGDVIIVANGTYYENIDFMGKDITVTSNYAFSGDLNDILTTIIDGSQPTDPDIGSCVSFKNGETNDAIIQGFTITGGSGTKTFNPSDNAYFRTGGGILINESAPTIKYNIIKDNHCIAEAGVSGAGGGGIRMGFGQPVVTNNIIKNNSGGYAGGMMIAYCGGATIKNNLIAYNLATGSFDGGGGVYVDWEAVTLENNTIVYNHSGNKGGGLITTGTVTLIKNCIIYGNTSSITFPQIYRRFGGNVNITYSNLEGGIDGEGDEEGMIDEDPLFENNANFVLSSTSPCIDSGNPDSLYNDIEDPNSPGNALFPAMGTLRNDMGVYGGQGTVGILAIETNALLERMQVAFPNPYHQEGVLITTPNDRKIKVIAYDLTGKLLQKLGAFQLQPGANLVPISLKTNTFLVIYEENGFKNVYKLIVD